MGRSGTVGAVLAGIVLLVVAVLVGTTGEETPGRPNRLVPEEPSDAVITLAGDPGAMGALPPDWRWIEGLVLDAGTLIPIAGARVMLRREDEEAEAKTDEWGRWRLPLPRFLPKAGSIEVSARGYLPGREGLRVNWNEKRTQRVAPPVLLRPATVEIRGRVLDHDGRPVVNALVSGDGEVPAQLRTDRAGAFGPMPAGPGEFGIEVYAPGGIYWWEVFRVPRDATDRFDVTLRIPKPQFATGVTVDDRGLPLAGVDVSAEWPGDRHGVRSGADGSFRWPLTGEDVRLFAKKDGYVQTSWNVAYAGAHVEVVMERAASIEGRVLLADGSPPPPGVRIQTESGLTQEGEVRVVDGEEATVNFDL